MMDKIHCIIVDDEVIAREILESYVKKTASVHLIKSCKNVTEALKIISEIRIDLILLDINMPDISGITLAKVIDKKIKIIFTTAYREYAVDGFDMQAVDYLLKPISFDRFTQAMGKYMALNQLNLVQKKDTNHNFIFVRSDRKMVKISFDEILFIESLSDYIKIYTTNKTIITRETISNMEAKLSNFHFIRIHRSYIVSVSQIETYTNEFVELNKKAIPISRKYKDAVLKKLTSF